MLATPEGYDRVDFNALSIPPTLDDIFDAIDNRTFVASPKVCDTFGMLFKNRKNFIIEQFNFGKLPSKVIDEAQTESLDFVEYNLFKPPYEVCLYRCSIEFIEAVVGTSLLVVEGNDDGKYPGIATIQMVHSAEHMVAMHSINMMNVKPGPKGRAVELSISHAEIEFWHTAMQKDGLGPPTALDLADGSMTMLGLTMILNTKGVFKDRVEPPRKPNIARAKHNRPLLPYVTHVHTQAYLKSTTEHVPGHHASPRPHRRRAHVRHLENGKAIPIASMLVNWDGSPLQRGAYEVSP